MNTSMLTSSPYAIPHLSRSQWLSTAYLGYGTKFRPCLLPTESNRQPVAFPLIAMRNWVCNSIPISLTPMLIGIVLAANVSLPDTFSNVPRTLSGEDKGLRIQKPKSSKAESCTNKCVGSCIRGSEGPLNIRRPLVVFKDGFRSRQYCLIECSDICNLIKDGDDGP